MELIIGTLTEDSSTLTNVIQTSPEIFTPLEKSAGTSIPAKHDSKTTALFSIADVLMDTPRDC